MADTTDLKSVAYGVGVRVPFPAPFKMYGGIIMIHENTSDVEKTTQPAEEIPTSAESPKEEKVTPEAEASDVASQAETIPEVPAHEKALAEMKERYLRLLADFDNMRKRQARELEEGRARANERLLKELIPVFDHFEMALSAAKEDDPFVQGVKMIAAEFRKVLEQSGAAVIDASEEGGVVDPMKHEVLSMLPHATIAQGQIVSQFRKGWTLGGKVVRPAQVIVSAGAPEGAEGVN